MPATVRRLLRETSLGLTLVGSAGPLDEPILWIHGSDLADPTPFLSDGQMLLTTGTQFPDTAVQAQYDEYVHRLTHRGVVALGFGTEVVRSGTPRELIAACERGGLPLLEVPYVTPFIAIIRWSADVLAREARARDDWSLSAQRAISLAALSQGGLSGVLTALAHQLGGRVAVFESSGELDVDVSPSTFDDEERAMLEAEATRLLERGRRAAGALVVGDERASLQTLGRRNELRGVLAIVGAPEFDSAAQAVLTSAVAIAEVALEQDAIRRAANVPLHRELLLLLLAGQIDLVRRVFAELPAEPIVVVRVRARTGVEQASDATQRVLGHRAFVGALGDDVVALVTQSEWATSGWQATSRSLPASVIAGGVSQPVLFDQLGAGMAQARRALAIALRTRGALVEFAEVRDSDFIDALSQPGLIEAADARLANLLADDAGRSLLHCASVWLSHNGAWDPAARELGIHRHSLKARVEQVGRSLDLSLDSFADRAQLWAMLAAHELSTPTL